MKKALLGLLLAVLVIALVVYVGMQFFLGSAVTKAVNSYGPTLTQTKVELASAKLSPFSGVGTLNGLKVGNPAGWSPGNAFSVATIHIDMEPFSVLGDHVVINEIVIDQPEFLYETRLVASNIGDLLKNIEKATGAGTTPAEKDAKPIRIEVKKFTLQNGRVTVGIGAAALALPVPPIVLQNVGTGTGGVTPAQFSLEIMRSVTQSVAAVAVDAVAKGTLNVGGQAGDTVKKAGELLQGVLGGSKK